MPHVTSIGLDVHARSVAAAAFNPFTGEVVHRDFGTDAAEIAEWALGFEEPRACYESGPTGFRMARELRALGLDNLRPPRFQRDGLPRAEPLRHAARHHPWRILALLTCLHPFHLFKESMTCRPTRPGRSFYVFF